MHTHPVINAGVLVSGELTVITDSGQTLHLKPGDPIVEVVDTWHYGKNEGTDPADIIVFYAGEKGGAHHHQGPGGRHSAQPAGSRRRHIAAPDQSVNYSILVIHLTQVDTK